MSSKTPNKKHEAQTHQATALSADAYLSLEEANQYCAVRDMTSWANASEAARRAALLKASDWLDNLFRFRGEKLSPSQQRQWPRRGAGGAFSHSPSALPPAVIQVVMELALAFLVSDDEAARYIGIGNEITRERIGDVAISYDHRRPAGGTRASQLLSAYLERSVQLVRS